MVGAYAQTRHRLVDFFFQRFTRHEHDWCIGVTDPIQLQCLRYCFMDLIQAELDRIAQNWNTHEIRQQKNANVPCGKPDIIHFVPEIYGGHNFGNIVDLEDVKACIDMYADSKRMYSDEIRELSNLVLPDHELPSCAQDALCMFRQIFDSLYRYLHN